MSDCCKIEEKEDTCHPKKTDWLFWTTLFVIVSGYSSHLIIESNTAIWMPFSHSVFSLMNQMLFGVILGIFFVGILSQIPRDFVMSVLGRRPGIKGIVRATVAGLLFDLCSHGILLIGLKLYERGASLGQMIAFLVASPWNSLSLTIILVSLIGLKWTLTFVVLSGVVAIVSGMVFEWLVTLKVLPQNPNRMASNEDFYFFKEVKSQFRWSFLNSSFFKAVIKDGLEDSKMLLRWIFVGVIATSLIRVFVSDSNFQQWFGPSIGGLFMTLVSATVMEVCSEGLAPIAGDLVMRAFAPGNSFAFLMTGVATDYTEIMGIKERTGSWKIALFLPLVTVPQVAVLGYVLNTYS